MEEHICIPTSTSNIISQRLENLAINHQELLNYEECCDTTMGSRLGKQLLQFDGYSGFGYGVWPDFRLIFFAKNEAFKEIIITTLFPILVSDSLICDSEIQPSVLDDKQFCHIYPHFKNYFRNLEDMTCADFVCTYEGKKYFRFLIVTAKDDVQKTYLKLFDIFGFTMEKVEWS